MRKAFIGREGGAHLGNTEQVSRETDSVFLASSRMHILPSILLLSIYLSIYLIMGYRICGKRRKRLVNMYVRIWHPVTLSYSHTGGVQ